MKYKIVFLVLVLVNLSFQNSATQNAQQKLDPRLSGLDQEIENLIRTYKAAGLSVAVVENDQIIYANGFGFSDYENKVKATPNTVFPIGSITKSFTASLVGLLASENKINLQEKPSTYIPAFQFYNDRMNNLITVEDLLCHKTGLGSVDGSYVLFPPNDRKDLMPRLKYIKPNGPIKEGWMYSNMGYIIAGTIIEEVSHEAWNKNIQDKLFTPLRMKQSSTSLQELLASPDHALGYGIHNGQMQKVLLAELNADAPGGGINSTAKDMSNWMIAWLNQGKFQNKTVLPEDYIQQATSLKAIDNGLTPESSDPSIYALGYGYGWKINSSKGHYKVQHGGNVSGFSSNLVFYPTDHVGIVVLTNQHNSILPYLITDIISNRMLKLELTPWDKYPVKVDDIYTVSSQVKDINPEKKPTHDLSAYCGKFFNPGYGTFEIRTEGGLLYAVFPNYKFRVEHQLYDIFKLKGTTEIPQVMNPEFTLNFSMDNDGNLNTVKIDLQAEPVEFLRVNTN